MRNIYLLLIVFFVGCYDSIVVDDARECRTLSSGQVVSETNFFFGAAQSLSDTVRGVCITHILGPVAECESRDTLPVFFIVKNCRGYPDNNGR